MVLHNQRSLMISVNDAKDIHLFPIFRSYFPELFTLKVKPFINSFQYYLFCYKYWLNYFLAVE